MGDVPLLTLFILNTGDHKHREALIRPAKNRNLVGRSRCKNDPYRQAGRPHPLYRARHLERFLGTPAKLYYKREDLSPTGSHKINTALAQAYYAAEEGCPGVSTETEASQWGTALAYAASLQRLKCIIFWVRSVYDWKPDPRAPMQLYGGKVFASPSHETTVSRDILAKNPDHVGSLGIAVSEDWNRLRRILATPTVSGVF